MEPNLMLALNSAISARNLAWMNAMGIGTALDAKRPQAWSEYGYPSELTAEDFYSLYDRHAIANGAADILRDTTWQKYPEVIEGDDSQESTQSTAWDKAAKKLTKKTRLWKAFKAADGYRMVQGWSALLLQYRDGLTWDKPVGSEQKDLVGVIPVWSTRLTPGEMDTDDTSVNFGQPKTWQFQEAPLNSQAQGRSLVIHPDRIFLLGDWRNPRSFYRAAYNNFINIEKIEGGSGESFLKNAARQLGVNFDKSVDLKEIAKAHNVDIGDLQKLFNETAQEVNRGNDLLFITQGAQTTPLVAQVSDPKPHYEINLSSIAASFGIPVKVLVGMQTGERASTEDLKQLNKRCQGYRELELNDEITDLMSKLSLAGVLPYAPEDITILWDDLTESTASEKLDQADKMAAVNQKMVALGEVFTREEIRTAGGFENDIALPPLPEPAAPAAPINQPSAQ